MAQDILTVAIIGAGGKMGSRLTNNLYTRPEYRMVYAESGEAGQARLKEKNLSVVTSEEAVKQADITILAVPDSRIGTASSSLVPLAKSGSTLIVLDPASAVAGELSTRQDMCFVVTHPCHPPLFGEQKSDEARRDFFGGVAAWQDIVIALMQGSEEKFLQAEALCKTMFGPVRNSHRITVDQMAILEPAMAEVVAAAAAVLMKDAMEEAIKAGVPRPAAEAFMMGHAQIPLAIVFGAIKSPFSDAAKIAVHWGTEKVIRPDWRKVFEKDQIRSVIQEMLHPGAKP